MRYSRHAGQSIAELPGIYLIWMAHQGFHAANGASVWTHKCDHSGRSLLHDRMRAATPAHCELQGRM